MCVVVTKLYISFVWSVVPAISLECLCNGRLKVATTAPLYTDVLSKRSWRIEQGREGMADAILSTESGKVLRYVARCPYASTGLLKLPAIGHVLNCITYCRWLCEC
jgi:hypothetical protein